MEVVLVVLKRSVDDAADPNAALRFSAERIFLLFVVCIVTSFYPVDGYLICGAGAASYRRHADTGG